MVSLGNKMILFLSIYNLNWPFLGDVMEHVGFILKGLGGWLVKNWSVSLLFLLVADFRSIEK